MDIVDSRSGHSPERPHHSQIYPLGFFSALRRAIVDNRYDRQEIQSIKQKYGLEEPCHDTDEEESFAFHHDIVLDSFVQPRTDNYDIHNKNIAWEALASIANLSPYDHILHDNADDRAFQELCLYLGLTDSESEKHAESRTATDICDPNNQHRYACINGMKASYDFHHGIILDYVLKLGELDAQYRGVLWESLATIADRAHSSGTTIDAFRRLSAQLSLIEDNDLESFLEGQEELLDGYESDKDESELEEGNKVPPSTSFQEADTFRCGCKLIDETPKALPGMWFSAMAEGDREGVRHTQAVYGKDIQNFTSKPTDIENDSGENVMRIKAENSVPLAGVSDNQEEAPVSFDFAPSTQFLSPSNHQAWGLRSLSALFQV